MSFCMPVCSCIAKTTCPKFIKFSVHVNWLGPLTAVQRCILLLVSSRPTQPPALRRMGNDHRPRCSDAVWLGSRGRMAHSIYG